MPAHSDIPPGLSPEEKKAYIRERNRLKQARLRARRNEKIKDLEDKVALAEAAKLLPGGLADQPAVGSSRSAELPAGVAKVEEGGGLLLSGSFPGGDSAGANEVELLERVVARMKEKLVQLGVGEDEIQQLMVQAGEGGGTGGSELGWIASSASPAPETNPLHSNVPSFNFGASPPSPSSSASSSTSRRPLQPPMGVFDPVSGRIIYDPISDSAYQPVPPRAYPCVDTTTSMSSLKMAEDPSWMYTMFDIHAEAYRLRRMAREDTGGDQEIGGAGGLRRVDETALAGIQLSILRLLASTASNPIIAYPFQPTAEDFQYLATQTMDERIVVLPSGPGVKVALAKAVASGTIDLTDLLAEIIETAVVRGDPFDHSVDQFGFSLPLSFFAAHPCLVPFVPRDIMIAAESSPYATPFPSAGTRKGLSIKEIVLGVDHLSYFSPNF